MMRIKWSKRSLVVAISFPLLASRCVSTEPVQEDPFLQDLYKIERPSSLWQVGTVVELQQDGGLRYLGKLQSCDDILAKAPLKTDRGDVAQHSFFKSVNYSVNLETVLGTGAVDLLNAALRAGGTDEKPVSQGRLVVDESYDEALNVLAFEQFLSKAFEDRRAESPCELALTDPKRLLVEQAYMVEEGRIGVSRNNGASIDLTAPPFELLRKASLEAGFTVSEEGQIVISRDASVDEQPIVIGIRLQNYADTIGKITGTPKGGMMEPGSEVLDVLTTRGVVTPAAVAR